MIRLKMSDLEYVEELSERFPDLSNSQIFDNTSEYLGRNLSTVEETIILSAYNHGIERALKTAELWGGLIAKD